MGNNNTQLNIDLEGKEDKAISKSKGNSRAKEAQKKKKDAKYEPTWEEVWETGYTRHTGTRKKGVFQTKLTKPDKERLLAVKEAIEEGDLGVGVENLRKFSKAHALRLYQELKDIRRSRVVKEMKENKPDNYYLVNSEERLQEFMELLDEEEVVALDTETTGLDWVDKTVGFSLTLPKADIHFYVPYAHKTTREQIPRDVVMDTVRPYLERPDLKIVYFNSKFDIHMMDKDNIDLQHNNYFDVYVAMHVLNENEKSRKLKDLANKYGKYFGYEDESLTFSELFGKDPKHFIEADLEIASIYACKDTDLTYRFYEFQMELFNNRPALKEVYFDIEKPNTDVSLTMEKEGFEIDLDFAKTYREELEKEVSGLEEEIADNWGDINVNSPKQLKEKLFGELGYKDISGKGSVAEDVLKELADEREDVQVLLDYREKNKLLSTYIKPLPEMIRQDVPEKDLKGDGRLHGQFNQAGTVTGRYSSNNPNLQNIPERARKLFIAEEGKIFIGLDYSQIEPRTLAHLSESDKFRDPYINGGDLYVQIASDVYDIPYENALEADDTYWREHTDLPKHPRKLAKVILLAVMYGISPHGLAPQLGTTEEEAKEFINDFYESYPTVREYMDRVIAFADKNGYVRTMFGRKRRFIGHPEQAKKYKSIRDKVVRRLGYEPDNPWAEKDLPYNLRKSFFYERLDYEKVERMSVNSVIQGSAGDILKMAMRDVHEYLKDKDGWNIISTIHDEMMFEIPETATKEEIYKIEEIMINAVTLDVPIKVDVEVMKRWGEGVTVEEWFKEEADKC